MNHWEDILSRVKPKDEPKAVLGRPPSLSPEECKDVRELVAERVRTDREIKELREQVAKTKAKIAELQDRKNALTNSEIGRVFNVSHNIIRQVVLGQYRWKEVDDGHSE